MVFFKFEDEDIIDTYISARPQYTVELNGDQVTGSIYLEKKFLIDPLLQRKFRGLSQKQGGIVERYGPFSSSVELLDAEQNATNKQLYESILELYDYYSAINSNYTPYFTGSETTRFRVIAIPEIYFDKQIITGSFSASDHDKNGDVRALFDDGLGGVYSGSLSGTLVGNIFYNEGLVVFKGGTLNDEAASNDFGEVSPDNFKWRVNFQGLHNIPVKIFRCRAPSGQLNASTNESYYTIPTNSDSINKNEKEIILDSATTYITTIGLFNDQYELVGLAKVAQPIKKDENRDILFRLRLDF